MSRRREKDWSKSKDIFVLEETKNAGYSGEVEVVFVAGEIKPGFEIFSDIYD